MTPRRPRLLLSGSPTLVFLAITACGDTDAAQSASTAGKGGIAASATGGAAYSGSPMTSGGVTSSAGTGGTLAGTGGAPLGGGGTATGGGTANGGTSGASGGAPAGTGGAASGGGGASSGGAGPDGGLLPPFEGEGVPWEAPAPRATCRTGDTGETGVQGLGTDVRCNVDVVGQVAVEHFLSLAWHERCAYVNGQTGTTVVDVADPTKPTVVTRLTTTGMQSNWESMKVHSGRGLLVGYQSTGPVLDVYDVSQDCKAPVFRKSYNLAGSSGHSGNFSNDGTIYYASSLYTGQVFAVDLTDPANPTTITSVFDRGTHDLNVGKSGTRGYFVFSQLLQFTVGSLAIMDLSQVQSRAANAKGTLIKEITWPDGAASQYPIPVTYRGKDYLVMTDELGSGACTDPTRPQYGYARIFDISDETNPTLVSKIKTQAQDPAYCQQAVAQAGGFFGVGTHYCNVDRQENPRILSCGLWSAGVRLYDIRNPWRPKEIAYFNTAGTMVPGLTRILPEERKLWAATTTTFYVLGLPDDVVGPILAD
jgi:hypothetical protein